MLIDKDIKGKLSNHILGYDWDDYDAGVYEDLEELTFLRLAINEDQIEKYNMPTKPRKEGEKRLPNVKETVEAEAMPVETLIEIMQHWFNQFIPPEDFKVLKAAEESEREGIRKINMLHGLFNKD